YTNAGLPKCTDVFFFSSRRRHTRWPRDWSSDVCSSDLQQTAVSRGLLGPELVHLPRFMNKFWPKQASADCRLLTISEFSRMFPEIGRASCRERGWVPVVAAALTRQRWLISTIVSAETSA